METQLVVVGGGLAGAEAAWQAAELGVEVRLFEMRPAVPSGVHQTGALAELVCTDSLGPAARARDRGVAVYGQPILRRELEVAGALLMRIASECRREGRRNFAVDKARFAASVTRALEAHPRVEVVREEVTRLPEGPAVLATGPLTSAAMAREIAALVGPGAYHGFESSAPVVHVDSIARHLPRVELEHGGRRTRALLCPLTREQLDRLLEALRSGERVAPHPVETFYIEDMKIPELPRFDHEGGRAIELLDERALLAGALSPRCPAPSPAGGGAPPCAVVKLLEEPEQPELYRLLGFQTKLRHGAQERVIRLVPGLENARIVRFGHMHLSCFITSNQCLPSLRHKSRPGLYFAGELVGTDTYLAAIGTGWLAGQNAARAILGAPELVLPRTTLLGALCHHLWSRWPDGFQPIVPNLTLLDPAATLAEIDSDEACAAIEARSVRDLRRCLAGAAPALSG